MKIKYVVTGILLFFLIAFGITYGVKHAQMATQKYYENLKMQSIPKDEKMNQMESYLKDHKNLYLIKEIIRDSVSLTVEYWYGVTVAYSFLEEGFD